MTDTLISFGSNLGGSERIISDALSLLDSHPEISKLQRSSLVCTKPIGGPTGQPDFINGVARFSTELPPNRLMELLLDTERQFGRERRIRWDARVLDLDILLYGSEIQFNAECEIPHPRMTFRPFALEPACELAADMVHPICGIKLSDILQKLRVSKRAVKFIGDSKKFDAVAENLISEFSEWKFLHQSFSDFEKRTFPDSDAKLSIFLMDRESKSKFLTQPNIDAGRFANPILLLDDADVTSIATETTAAIAAMDELT